MNIAEFTEKLATDSALKEKLLAARKDHKEEAFLTELGCDFTVEDVKEHNRAEREASGEISDEELAGVTGGTGTATGGKTVGVYDHCDHFVCINCGRTYQELLPVSNKNPNGVLEHDGGHQNICYECVHYDWWQPICWFNG